MINVTLSTPEKEYYKGEAKKVTISTSSGEISVLAGHEPLMTVIQSGQIVIEKIVDKNNEVNSEDLESSDTEIFSAFSGVVNIENDKGKTNVIILLENSEDVNGLDEKTLQDSVDRAAAANKEKPEDVIDTNIGLLRDMNKLKLIRRYK
jgi:F0F1-type ATP synthase epsilon subunit